MEVRYAPRKAKRQRHVPTKHIMKIVSLNSLYVPRVKEKGRTENLSLGL
jgi:hypothetical protein